ncbi:MAG: hypothetical protein ACRELG_25160 [Gemmataceae bacterium]
MTATLPTVAQEAALAVGEKLAAKSGPLPQADASELVLLVPFIGEMFSAFLQSVNEALAGGVGSRSLCAKLAEGIAAAERTIRECAEMEDALAKGASSPRLAEVLREARGKIEKARGELTTILDFASTPPALPSLDKLAEAAKGPFVRLQN